MVKAPAAQEAPLVAQAEAALVVKLDHRLLMAAEDSMVEVEGAAPITLVTQVHPQAGTALSDLFGDLDDCIQIPEPQTSNQHDT